MQGAFETVHRSVIGPAPPVCVNVAFAVVAFGVNVPVTPPVTMDHVPVPPVGVVPPRPAVVPRAQIVCGPPAPAVGCAVTVTEAGSEAFDVQPPFVPVTVYEPVSPVTAVFVYVDDVAPPIGRPP